MPKITVWSKPSCVQCTATYRDLDKRGIGYEVRDLTQEPDAVVAFKALGLLSAPIVEVEGNAPWAGYQPTKISDLAAKHALVAA
jgi:glutaredoxin-like protein NrdH